MCPIGPVPKIGAFPSGANFSKLNCPIIPKNIQFHYSNFNFAKFDQLVLYFSLDFSIISRNNLKMENQPNDVQIYKPHINGKPKRPGTHWYHYLGSKVAVVAGKPDLIFGRFHFRCNFQTVRSLQKGTTYMSSEGPKMVERSYGWPEVAGKWLEITKLR